MPGHPISSSEPAEQPLPMAFQPKRAFARAAGSHHRPSRSISSLPVVQLSKINCDKRTSVSALSSPAAATAAARVDETTEKEMKPTSIGSLLAQDGSPRRKGARSGRSDATNSNAGGDSGCESDRKPSSFNLFRGHRRVGSGSNITSKAVAWDGSPRAKLQATTASTRSATGSPKKMDKYAVAKLAASLFHSPGTKLERSQSQKALPASSSSSSPRCGEKKRERRARTAEGRELLLVPGNGEPFPEDWVPRRNSCSAAQHMEETSPPPTPTPTISSLETNNTSPEEAPAEVSSPRSPLDRPLEEDPSPSAVTSNSDSQLETSAVKILHVEKFGCQVPALLSIGDKAAGNLQPWSAMPDILMEGLLPDSPTASIAALFEDESSATATFDTPDATGEAITKVEAPTPPSDCRDRHVWEGGDLPEGDRSHFLPRAAMNDTTEKPKVLRVATEDLIATDSEEALTTDAAVQRTEVDPTPFAASQEQFPPSPFPEVAAAAAASSSPPPFPASDSPEPPEPSFPFRDLPVIRVSSSSSSSPRRLIPGMSPLLLPPPPEPEPASCNSKLQQVKVHHVVNPTLRKRRRSASGSGLSAMLLKVVRVPEEGTIVTRRFVQSPEWGAQLQMQMESSSPDPRGGEGVHSGSGVCESEPEDAVKSTYSKFVDIEIDPGHGCVELVQHSKDAYRDFDTVDNIGWKRHPQAAFFERQFRNSPRRLPLVKVNTCTVYEGKARSRKSKTIRRGRMNSYDLDTLKEYLKTTNSLGALARADATTETREAGVVASPLPSPPPHPEKDSNLSTRERSCTFMSRLQAPSPGAFSYVDVDVYRPCSVSILSNPSFSSSHQDKLWEEQAEIYSSGGRGTPGRDDDDGQGYEAAAPPPAPPQTLLYNLHHSPLPGIGSLHRQLREPPPPRLRRSTLGSGGSLRSVSSESGHFMQQIMSKIRGSSPKRVVASATLARAGSCPASQQLEISKRRNPWSSCICFSVKS